MELQEHIIDRNTDWQGDISRFFSGATERQAADFLAKYVQFNRPFGACVARMAGGIALSYGLFQDGSQPRGAFSDNSTEIGRHIFSAAVDEFGCGDYPMTHRRLAISALKCFLSHSGDTRVLADFLKNDTEIDTILSGVIQGYAVNTLNDAEPIFHAMGFHIASEVLADIEFNFIDTVLVEKFPELMARVKSDKTPEDGTWAWLTVHKSVEVDHANAAQEGITLALESVDKKYSKEQCLQYLTEGITDFKTVQNAFFDYAGL